MSRRMGFVNDHGRLAAATSVVVLVAALCGVGAPPAFATGGSPPSLGSDGCTLTGIICTFTGDGSSTAPSSGSSATATGLESPQGVAVDAAGDVFIADASADEVLETPAATGTQFGMAMTAGHTYVLVGNGSTGTVTSGSPIASSQLNNPTGVAIDASGNLLIADEGSSAVEVIAAQSCGSGCPYGISSMTADDIYVVAGQPGSAGDGGDGGPAASAQLIGPVSVAVDTNGDLFIDDADDDVIREVAGTSGTQYGIAMTSGDIYTVAGGPDGYEYGGDGMASTSGLLQTPTAVAVDSDGDLFIADSGDCVIREVPSSQGAASTSTEFGVAMTAGDIYTVAGQEDQCTNSDYFGDGAPALDTGLGDSLSLTVDAAGDLFITDASEAVVREVAATSGNQYGIAMTAGDIYTLAGQANSTGYSATAGPAVNAQLSSPEGVAVDAAGDLLFADADNHVVRAIAAGSPAAPAVSLSCPAGTNNNTGNLSCTVTADPRSGTVAAVSYAFENSGSNNFSGTTDITTHLASDGHGGLTGQFTIPASDLAAAANTVVAYATDSADSLVGVADSDISYDTIDPPVVLDSVTNSVSGTSVTLSGTANVDTTEFPGNTIASAVMQYSTDDGSHWTNACTLSSPVSGAADSCVAALPTGSPASLEFQEVATDAAGNVTQSSTETNPGPVYDGSVSVPSVPTAPPSSTTSLTNGGVGYTISGYDSSTQLVVTIATDLGTLTIPSLIDGASLAYGYSSTTAQTTISIVGTESEINPNLAALELNSPASGIAHVSVFAAVLNSTMVYSPLNQHFYQYVPWGSISPYEAAACAKEGQNQSLNNGSGSAGQSWAYASCVAATMSYGGQQGYLATLPTFAIDNSVTGEISGATNVWFGAYATDYDAGTPGIDSYGNAVTTYRIWRWTGGPLTGQSFSECSQPVGQGNNFSGDPESGWDSTTDPGGQGCYPVGSADNEWAGGEPNDAGVDTTNCFWLDQEEPPLDMLTNLDCGEHYGVTNWQGSLGRWNDLDGNSNRYGTVDGFLVEYGDQATGSTQPVAGSGTVGNTVAIGGPNVTIVCPVGWSGANVQCTADADPTINGATISTITYSINGGSQRTLSNLVADGSGGKQETFTIPAGDLVIGANSVVASATDNQPVTALSNTATIDFDDTAPSVVFDAINTPSADTSKTLSGTATAHTADDVSNAIDAETFQYSTNGGTTWTTACTVAAPISGSDRSCSWNTATLPNGTYTLRLVATDALGNVGTSATRTVTIDNASAPTTTTPTTTTKTTPTRTKTPPRHRKKKAPTVSGTVTATLTSSGSSSGTGASGVDAGIDDVLSPSSVKAPAGAKISGYSWSIGGKVLHRTRSLPVKLLPHSAHPYTVSLVVKASNGTKTTVKYHVRWLMKSAASTIHFAFNDPSMSRASAASLRKFAIRLRNGLSLPAATATIKVTGFASGTATGGQLPTHELMLSRQRAHRVAAQVRDELKRYPAKFTVGWRGGGSTVASNATAAGRAANRRVTVVTKISYVKIR